MHARHTRTSLPLLRTGLIALTIAGLAACTTTPPRGASGQAGAPNANPTRPQQQFIRPAAGATVARFNGQGNKGIDIAGSAGDPVRASADGRVVYAGSDMRGYGNMIIVKHNETFLTAYAHNRKLLVKETDVVQQGQQIAEMGSSGTDKVKLHFEIRKQGTAVDPEPYLSGRLR